MSRNIENTVARICRKLWKDAIVTWRSRPSQLAEPFCCYAIRSTVIADVVDPGPSGIIVPGINAILVPGKRFQLYSIYLLSQEWPNRVGQNGSESIAVYLGDDYAEDLSALFGLTVAVNNPSHPNGLPGTLISHIVNWATIEDPSFSASNVVPAGYRPNLKNLVPGSFHRRSKVI